MKRELSIYLKFNKLMNILGIDTSTNNCSVGIVINGKLVGRNAQIGRSMASEQLISLIDDLLKQSIPMSEIDAIAVSIGPGSYTGLRIGLSTAKGLAFARRLPVLPVPTMVVLESVARQTIDSDMVLMIKSHRDLAYHVYCQKENPLHIDSIDIGYDSFFDIRQRYQNQYLYISPSEISDPDFNVVETLFPEGDHVALLAHQHYQVLRSQSVPGLEPLYLSEFEVKKWKPKTESG
ncbi:MAG: tRNA (adenosine(37)-N6)-threonylcarbamoyltransferase complex dimerization subunit type 1 TsaB [Candidatus Marinimicrobia bacterium]|nr:tRNA (adenosine(37)-N6)-threonylcarbamoyltransferase complex dimerization subunit type 1 TsaB [Candidatus Neomarinimicrobiota bacterium]